MTGNALTTSGSMIELSLLEQDDNDVIRMMIMATSCKLWIKNFDFGYEDDILFDIEMKFMKDANIRKRKN